MKPERARLVRMHRLERIRAIAKQAAAREAAEAETTLGQLEALTRRTSSLAADYAGRTEARDGADLQQLSRFTGGLQAILESSSNDTARARDMANAKMTELHLAERRRAAVEDRAQEQSRAIEKRENPVEIGPYRRFGTDIE
ncbi:MAG: hypothetical protein KUG65_02710 [Sphingomonadaceae bacterium]|nr:hypothetical protein [Sphingomonadaceae bacterium]